MPGVAALVTLATLATGCPSTVDRTLPGSSTTAWSAIDSTAAATSTTAATGSTVPASSSTAPPATEEEAVKARYLAFWEARFQANQPPPNPDLPALREYATGKQLDNVIAETRRNLEDGLAVRHPDSSVARSTVRVVEIKGDAATLQECAVDDGIIYRFQTGEIVNSSVATHSVSATMQRTEGVWKLADTKLLQRWEGVAGCALAGSS